MIKQLSFFLAILISFSLISAADIAYVVKTAPEASIINAITEAGYDYELVYDSNIPSTNFSNYEMILVWDEALSNYNKIPITQKRSLIGSGRSTYLDYWGIADYANNLGSNNYESGIILLEHEITGDLIGTIPLYNNKDAELYVLPLSAKNRAPGLKRLVSTNYDRAVIGAIDSGGSLYGGGTAKERIVFFGISETEFWTEESKELFKNSLSWLISEDKDLDGFFDDDCDDNNPEINPDAEELIDDIDQNCVNDAPVLIRGMEIIAWTEGKTRQIHLNDYFADPEGDSMTFSIYESAEYPEINISINNGLMTLSSVEGWTGEDMIVLRTVDSEGKEKLTDEITLRVLASNSAPVINDYSPKGSIRIPENINQEFKVSVSDAEGFLNIYWFLDGKEVGSGSIYIFNQEKGTHSLEAFVTDGEYDVSKIWNVFAGDISELKCEEADGYLCSGSEYCALDNLLEVKDSANCCSVPCSPKFTDIDRCEAISNGIEIQIQDISENEEFKINEVINGKLKIKNNLEDLDFDVEIYLYDISEDEEIDRYKTSVELDKGREKILTFEFEAPESLDEDDDYAVFVRVIDDDEEYCNEKYVKIDIIREEHDVVISSFDFEGSIVCGNNLNIQALIKNIGKNDEEVYLVLENSELEIYEESENFELEQYSGDYKTEKGFAVKIPEDVEEGNYEIELGVFFESGKDYVSKELFVECDWAEPEISEEEFIEETNSNNLIIFLLIAFFALIISLLGFYAFSNLNSNSLKNFKSGSLAGFERLKNFNIVNIGKSKSLNKNKSKKKKLFSRFNKKGLIKLRDRIFK